MKLEHLEGYFALGRWVEDIRASRDRLDVPQTVELERIPNWSWDSSAKRTRSDTRDSFASGYAELLTYVERERTALVPTMVDGEISPLSRWVKERRTDYRHGRLTRVQIEQLETLPAWSWSAQQTKYDRWLGELAEFVQAHGHSNVPRSHRVETGDLGRWVTTQRVKYQDGTLSDDRRSALEQVVGTEWA